MTHQLPGPAAGYVRTTNGKDPAGFIALFAEDAVVDDAGWIIRSREAIRAWAASDIFAADVTFGVLDASGDQTDVTITAKVDGTFDRTGLPDPLIMTFRIAALSGKITKLTCRLAERYCRGDAERGYRLGASVPSPGGTKPPSAWRTDARNEIRLTGACRCDRSDQPMPDR